MGGGSELLEARRISSCSSLQMSPPPTSFLLLDDPLSQAEGNIATSSSDPKVGGSRASLASDCEDVPPDGQSGPC